MFNILIKGFRTVEEVEEFMSWYSNQGEQDSGCWFEERKADGMNVRNFIPIDDSKTFTKNGIKWDGTTAMMYVSEEEEIEE